MHPKIKNSKPQSAFTIVELLVVIVIIGILAAIVIIFYIGTHDKAIDGALQADLKGASTILELDKANGDLYPSTKENANGGKGLKSSDGTTLDYAYSSGDNSYCLTASKEGRSYYINSEGRVPVQGGCPVASVSTFARTWGGINNDVGFSITQANDGGIIAAGETYSYYGAGTNDAFITKYASDGNLLWNRTWNGSDNDWATSLSQSSDGGFVVAGNTYKYSVGNSDVYIAKYTADGGLLWNRTWEGVNDDRADAVIQSSDGGFIVAGETYSYGVSNQDVFFAKYTADGNLLWSKTWGGNNNDFPRSLIKTNDGGFAIAGGTYSYGAGSEDAFISKYTADGNLAWNKTWGGNSNEWANSLTQTNDGGFAIAGGTYSYGAGNCDTFISKYTIDGNLSWSRTWGGSNDDWFKSIIKANDGGLLIAGTTNSYGANGDDALIVKYTPDGGLLWNRTWGGDGDDWLNSLIQTRDGGFAAAGGTENYGAGNNDLLILKYDSDVLMNYCPISMCKHINATSTIPAATTTSPSAAITSPSAITSNPTAIITIPSATTTNPIPNPPPPMTITFSSQELYVAYPGESQSICKEWTAPNNKQIKWFKISQATESGYDYFTVSLDGTEKYKKSGLLNDQYVDTSSTPGKTLKACMSADGSVQEGYGGQVTGVFYE